MSAHKSCQVTITQIFPYKYQVFPIDICGKLKSSPTMTSGICVTTYDSKKRMFADVIHLKILNWEGYPGLFGWALNEVYASL